MKAVMHMHDSVYARQRNRPMYLLKIGFSRITLANLNQLIRIKYYRHM